MESSSSDEDDCQLLFWNNWTPPKTENLDVAKRKSLESRIPIIKDNLSDFSKASSIISAVENPKFGNWIPPPSFLSTTTTIRKVRDSISKGNQKHAERLSPGENNEINKKIRRDLLESSVNTATNSCIWRKNVNLDWGERIQLHDVTRFNDGDLIWGVVHLGVFGSMKLWVNEYGNINCLASGKISKLGSSEITFISITNTEVLRKMLNVSSSQWASLCESVKETKTVLKFDAFEDFDLTKRTSLEKLWFLICKRRHFLPRQCMLLKYCGAVKCLRKLEITPKLLVQDIRSVE